jgi:hypothetical protein
MRNAADVIDKGAFPKIKHIANIRGETASITTQPILLSRASPHPLLMCLPYGATIKSNAIKIIGDSISQAIKVIL